jgi:hypothetical protein
LLLCSFVFSSRSIGASTIMAHGIYASLFPPGE